MMRNVNKAKPPGTAQNSAIQTQYTSHQNAMALSETNSAPGGRRQRLKKKTGGMNVVSGTMPESVNPLTNKILAKGATVMH